MLSTVASRTLLVCLVIFVVCPAWGWPPSKDDKTRWKALIKNGKTEELGQLIEALRTQGEDIRQWMNVDLGLFGGSSFLSLAAEFGHLDIARLLVENGAEVNRRCNGITPVHRAVLGRHPEMLEYLLNLGAKVDGENEMTVTPLTQAIQKGYTELVPTLLNHGASVHPRITFGPLPSAARLGHRDTISELLSRGAKPDGDLLCDGRPLACAAGAGHLDAVMQLLGAGAQINLENYFQETAIVSAAENGHEDVVRYLLEQGADVSGRDPEAEPLSEKENSVREEQRGKLRQLAELEGKRFVGGSPLNRAAGNGHIPVVALLLQYEADVRHVDSYARAALQQVYRPGTGVAANFQQYIVEGKDLDFPVEPSGKYMSFSEMLALMFDKMAPGAWAWMSDQYSALINQAVQLTTLDLPDSVNFRYKNGERIVRIESYIISPDFIEVTDTRERDSNTVLSIVFTNEKGDRRSYVMLDYPDNWLRSMNDAAALGARVDEVFFYRGSPRLTQSRHINEQSFTVWHRKIVSRLMIAALEDNQELKRLATRERRIKGVLLYCLGCGSGEDIVQFHEALSLSGIESKIIGIEKDDEEAQKAIARVYLTIARQSSMAKEKIKPAVIRGTVQSVIPNVSNMKKHFDDPVIVVAEEFFSRTVLEGTYEALHILQQLIQPDTADLVIIGGIYPPLVSERIASAVGWSVQHVSLYHSKEVSQCNAIPDTGSTQKECTAAFVLKRLNKEQQMASVYQRSLRRSVRRLSDYPPPFRTLDLSMFGLPQDALEYYLDHKENHKIIQIDLSYSYIEPTQLPAVVNLLMGFPAAKFVVASGFEPWYPELVKAMEGLQRLKLVQRKDNKYPHELPSLDPDTARLFGHYKTMPNQRVYEPPKGQVPDLNTWNTVSEERATGYIASHLIEPYHQQLLTVLSAHNIQLLQTNANNLCFFNAVAMQLDLTTADLQTILINQLQFNRAEVETQFPAFAGEQFDALMTELRQGQWGHAGLARLLSWTFNLRFIILYFNSASGQVTVQVYNPDGSGSETLASSEHTGIPQDSNEQAVMLVHNGLGHWLGGMNAVPDINLTLHNLALLNPPADQHQSSPEPFTDWQWYDPNMVTAWLAILMASWQSKFY